MHPLAAGPWALAGALAEVAAGVPWPSDAKLARTFTMRRDLARRYRSFADGGRDADRPLVWFHAPSVGEGLQVRPVLQLVRAAHPDWRIAYTYFSPSAERFAAGLGADFVAPLPFDTPRGAAMALDALRPRALVFGKLDVWPVLVAAASRRAVRVGIISATLAADAGRMSWWARALLGDAYAALEAVGAVDGGDADRLRQLGVPASALTVTGDTRYDQVWGRAQGTPSDAAVIRFRESARTAGPLLVAGSTWPSDDAVLRAAWPAVRAAVPTARLLVAPHELHDDDVAQWRAWAAPHGWTCARFDEAAAATADVVVIDRLGILGDCYGAGAAAFVGGGFHDAGLHSVLEPAAFGIPVVCGPRDARQRDAVALEQAGALRRVGDAAALAAAVVPWLSSDAGATAGAAARAVVQRGLGAAAKSLVVVEQLMRAS